MKVFGFGVKAAEEDKLSSFRTGIRLKLFYPIAKEGEPQFFVGKEKQVELLFASL